MMKWIAYQIICLNLAYVLIIQHMFLKVWPKSWLSVALFRFWANTFTLFETQIPNAEKMLQVLFHMMVGLNFNL